MLLCERQLHNGTCSAPAPSRRRATLVQPRLAALCSMVDLERGSKSERGRFVLTLASTPESSSSSRVDSSLQEVTQKCSTV